MLSYSKHILAMLRSVNAISNEGLSTTAAGPSMAYDDKSMTSLQYGNGPGYKGYSKKPDRNGRRLPHVKKLTPRLDPNSTDTGITVTGSQYFTSVT